MDYELFAKYDLSGKKNPWYLSAYTIRSLQLAVSQVLGFPQATS